MKKKKIKTTAERVNFSSLIVQVARPNKDLHRQDVEEVMQFLRNRIIEALAEGKRVELRGFGTFGRRQRVGYMGRNPRNGAAVYVSPRSVLYFKPGKEMRDRINVR